MFRLTVAISFGHSFKVGKRLFPDIHVGHLIKLNSSNLSELEQIIQMSFLQNRFQRESKLNLAPLRIPLSINLVVFQLFQFQDE